MKKSIILILAVVLVVLVIFFLVMLKIQENTEENNQPAVTNFEECVAAGNPVMESYPRQCRHGEKTFVENIEPILSKEEALAVARNEKECSKTGILTDQVSYNSYSKTWWVDLQRMPELEKDGCNPACVVSEQTKTAEVNWRCTGLKEPEVTACKPEQRNVDACTADYSPVCAKVNVQCITTPCNPVEETFSNACQACKNSLVESYVAGECVECVCPSGYVKEGDICNPQCYYSNPPCLAPSVACQKQ